MNQIQLAGHVVDIPGRRTYPAVVSVAGGKIESITPATADVPRRFILPGFIDAHVHIESAMLVPSEFARMAVVHGTTGTVSDPHEIANVCGVEGVQFMLDNGGKVPFKFCFGAPSCVPATIFETAGASIAAAAVDQLLQRPDVYYLSEMMNYPGVLHQDPEVMAKIAAAKRYGKPVDGHAPGLRGKDAGRYIAAGISTDHECFTLEEALDKLQYGMHILIREGSAARNFQALSSLIDSHPQMVMFCSDDKHPDNLEEGHINVLVKRSLAKGYNLYNILQAACINPVRHYGMPVGLLQPGDPADFIIVDNLTDFTILETYINGTLVAQNGETLIPSVPIVPINRFQCSPKTPADFRIASHEQTTRIKVIEALQGQLITNRISAILCSHNGNLTSDVTQDVLKVAVVNRYNDAPVACGFIHHFGLKHGAIASTVAHDSHNIIAVGADDESICKAVNELIACKGGISVVSDSQSEVMPLPVAGLMSAEDGYATARRYSQMDQAAKALGCRLDAPFMTLSFMALLVIPHLKLSDKGLFNGDDFTFEELVFPEDE
ncbi:adenine deaminase [Chitinophaga sp. GCM10012297]|uniref:Adenine deaminase n=1 Tax=Chitinophaga chungangae TaxID=2821488 RepID=A0ABS3YFH1_9BACT|nr:adenine deaminase [Chitinophaga chungangae]MBO9153422.1 adenine deaminase [Chitinophaga chungangae]